MTVLSNCKESVISMPQIADTRAFQRSVRTHVDWHVDWAQGRAQLVRTAEDSVVDLLSLLVAGTEPECIDLTQDQAPTHEGELDSCAEQLLKLLG